jgi:hypothetical protein
VRTNGFAVFKGEGAAQAAEDAIEIVGRRRWSRRVLLDAGDGFQDAEAVRLAGKRSVVLACCLEEEREGDDVPSYPLVHGFIDPPWEPADGPSSRCLGEYSVVGLVDGRLRGARDALGTRGLWTLSLGDGGAAPTGLSLASDHRLLMRPDRPLGEARAESTGSRQGAAAAEGGAPLRRGEQLRLIPAGGRYTEGETEGREKGRDAHGGAAAVVVVGGAREGGIGGEADAHPRPSSFEEAGRELSSLMADSVRRRVGGQRRVAVSFSGGLDSSLIAMLAARYTDVVLCSAYAEGSLDERQTERAAALLGIHLEIATIDEDSLMGTRVDIPPGEVATPMDRALSCIYSTTSRLASGRGARMILLGQLADELFGGYRKYSVAAEEGGPTAAESLMAHDVGACADKAFLRDEAACAPWAEARFPYADVEIAGFASRLPFDYKVREGERKAVLRAAARELGLPSELVAAPKKAAQFSSGAAKLLRRA